MQKNLRISRPRNILLFNSINIGWPFLLFSLKFKSHMQKKSNNNEFPSIAWWNHLRTVHVSWNFWQCISLQTLHFCTYDFILLVLRLGPSAFSTWSQQTSALGVHGWYWVSIRISTGQSSTEIYSGISFSSAPAVHDPHPYHKRWAIVWGATEGNQQWMVRPPAIQKSFIPQALYGDSVIHRTIWEQYWQLTVLSSWNL